MIITFMHRPTVWSPTSKESLNKVKARIMTGGGDSYTQFHQTQSPCPFFCDETFPRCSQQTILHVSLAGSIISSPLNKSLSEEWDPGNSPQSEFTPESCDGGLDCLKNQRFVYPLTLRKTGYCILSKLLMVVASRLCYIRTCFLHGQM